MLGYMIPYSGVVVKAGKERRRATATKKPSELKLRCQGSDGQRCGGEDNLAIQG